MPRLKAYKSGSQGHQTPVGRREAQETEERYRQAGQTRRQMMKARQGEWQVELRNTQNNERRSIRVFSATQSGASAKARKEISGRYGGRWRVERTERR